MRHESTTLDAIRGFTVARVLFGETSLGKAMARLGFVQADPIRAPARAQDLILRHRVRDYRAGDLERRYPELDLEEDFFVNYGFMTRPLHRLMHPRRRGLARSATVRRRTAAVLDFVRARGVVHPRVVDAHFDHGAVTNYWGGSSSATTHLLEDMHYRGLLRVARREAGVRLYAVRECDPRPATARVRDHRLDALLDAVVGLYAPLPRATLLWLVNRLRYATPQWAAHRAAAYQRIMGRLTCVHCRGTDWYWPRDEAIAGESSSRDRPDRVRLLTPFDPLVWDRRRFEMLWGWPYRFEAYTPAAKRQFGYYALPLLWREHIVGWANVAVESSTLHCQVGYVKGAPRERAFARALDAELEGLRTFLNLGAARNAKAGETARLSLTSRGR